MVAMSTDTLKILKYRTQLAFFSLHNAFLDAMRMKK